MISHFGKSFFRQWDWAKPIWNQWYRMGDISNRQKVCSKVYFLTIKHGGGSFLWFCDDVFLIFKMGPVHFFEEKMDRLKSVISFCNDNLLITWIFHHNNDLTHKAAIVTKWEIVLDWPAQIPELDPIENLP